MLHIYHYERTSKSVVMGIVYDCPVSEKRKRQLKQFNCDTSAKLYYAKYCNHYIEAVFEQFGIDKAIPHIKSLFWDQYKNIIQRSEILIRYEKDLKESIGWEQPKRDNDKKKLEELLYIARSWVKSSEKCTK